MAGPINPPAQEGPRGGELPAYVSNGLIGLRVREVPLISGMAIVSGVAGEHPVRRIEAALPVPYPLAGDLAIDGVALSDESWAVSDLHQVYDFASGELTSTFAFSTGGARVDAEVLTFASRGAPALVLQEVTVQADRACDLRLQARVDTTRLRGTVKRRLTGTPGEDEPVCDGSLLWEPEGGLCQCGFALDTELIGGDAECEVADWDAKGPLETTYTLRLAKGRKVRLRQIAAAIPSALNHRPDEEAVRRVARGRRTGFETLRKRNREAWNELWKSRIVIRGASEQHQALVDAAHQVKPTPAVPIRKSVSADAIICLEDGKSFKSLRRHLRAKYNMSPEEYRERWGLPDDYPMVAPNYTAQRSAHAKKLGLGQMQRTANKGAPSKSRTAARQ